VNTGASVRYIRMTDSGTRASRTMPAQSVVRRADQVARHLSGNVTGVDGGKTTEVRTSPRER